MSKTVMKVMMIGLVAMLGAKAEAHYFIVGGKAKYCSVCVDVHLAHNEMPSLDHPEEVKFSVTTTSVDILCPNGTQITSLEQFNLAVRRPIGPIDGGDFTTHDIHDVPPLPPSPPITAELEAIVSDTALLVSRRFCGVRPRDVLIRAMDLIITSNECTSTPCKTVSTFAANCTLSKKFDLKNYPKNLPPIGTLYDCPNPTITPQPVP